MYLFFDTETSDKCDFKAPPTAAHQPHLMQLAFILADEEGTEKDRFETIVALPEGVEPSEGAFKTHGISGDKSRAEGIPLWKALWEFERRLEQCHTLVAHNINFDLLILRTAHAKINFMHRLRERKHFCTMDSNTDILKLPGRYGKYKWPSLAEAHQHYLGCGFDGAHDALVDVEACMRVFYAMSHDTVQQG